MKGLLVLFMLKKITRSRSQLKCLRAKPASHLREIEYKESEICSGMKCVSAGSR